MASRMTLAKLSAPRTLTAKDIPTPRGTASSGIRGHTRAPRRHFTRLSKVLPGPATADVVYQEGGSRVDGFGIDRLGREDWDESDERRADTIVRL